MIKGALLQCIWYETEREERVPVHDKLAWREVPKSTFFSLLFLFILEYSILNFLSISVYLSCVGIGEQTGTCVLYSLSIKLLIESLAL